MIRAGIAIAMLLNLIAGTAIGQGIGAPPISLQNTGTGNVTGPNSSTARSLPIFTDTLGKVLADPGVIFADSVNQQAAIGFSATVPPYVQFYVPLVNSDTDATKNHAAVQGEFDWTASADSDASPEGVYGLVYLDAPRSFNAGSGAPAGVRANGYTFPQLTYTIVSGGTGHAVNNVITLTNGGATCSGFPQVVVTAVSGGVITGVTQVKSSGVCTVFPGGTWTQSASTGSGTGFSATIAQGAITAATLSGVYGRCRHQSLGTITICAGAYLDAPQNVGPGTVTNGAGAYIAGFTNQTSNQFGILIGTSNSPMHYLQSQGVSSTSWPFDMLGLADGGQIDQYIVFNAQYVSGIRTAPKFSGGGANFGGYIRQTASNASSISAVEIGRIPAGSTQDPTPVLTLDLLNSRAGIGITLPTTALDVVGTVHASVGYTAAAGTGIGASLNTAVACTITVTGGIITAKAGC